MILSKNTQNHTIDLPMYIAFLLLVTTLSYGLYFVCIRMSSGHIHTIVGAVFLQLVAAIFGVFLLGFLAYGGNEFQISNRGVVYSLLAGVFVSLAEICSFYVFSKGLPLSIGSPIVIGGAITISTLFAFLLLRESLSLDQWIGVGCVLFGVVLLTSG